MIKLQDSTDALLETILADTSRRRSEARAALADPYLTEDCRQYYKRAMVENRALTGAIVELKEELQKFMGEQYPNAPQEPEVCPECDAVIDDGAHRHWDDSDDESACMECHLAFSAECEADAIDEANSQFGEEGRR